MRNAKKLIGGLLVALALMFTADNVSADYCGVSQQDCGCVNLTCGGSGCTCEAWDSAWIACGGLSSCNSSGCDWDCGEGGEGRSCCTDFCPCDE